MTIFINLTTPIETVIHFGVDFRRPPSKNIFKNQIHVGNGKNFHLQLNGALIQLMNLAALMIQTDALTSLILMLGNQCGKTKIPLSIT